MLIPIVVEAAGALAENVHHIGVERDGLFLPLDVIGAVSGGAIGIMERLVLQSKHGALLGVKVLVLNLGGVNLHSTC